MKGKRKKRKPTLYLNTLYSDRECNRAVLIIKNEGSYEREYVLLTAKYSDASFCFFERDFTIYKKLADAKRGALHFLGAISGEQVFPFESMRACF